MVYWPFLLVNQGPQQTYTDSYWDQDLLCMKFRNCSVKISQIGYFHWSGMNHFLFLFSSLVSVKKKKKAGVGEGIHTEGKYCLVVKVLRSGKGPWCLLLYDVSLLFRHSCLWYCTLESFLLYVVALYCANLVKLEHRFPEKPSQNNSGSGLTTREIRVQDFEARRKEQLFPHFEYLCIRCCSQHILTCSADSVCWQ